MFADAWKRSCTISVYTPAVQNSKKYQQNAEIVSFQPSHGVKTIFNREVRGYVNTKANTQLSTTLSFPATKHANLGLKQPVLVIQVYATNHISFDCVLSVFHRNTPQRLRFLFSTLFPPDQPSNGAVRKFCLRTLPRKMWVNLQIDFSSFLDSDSSLYSFKEIIKNMK